MLGFLFSHKCLQDWDVGVLPSHNILIPIIVWIYCVLNSVKKIPIAEGYQNLSGT